MASIAECVLVLEVDPQETKRPIFVVARCHGIADQESTQRLVDALETEVGDHE